MNADTTMHLSEEQIDDVLIGLGSGESEAHLAVCAACREKVEDFQENVSAFRRASLAWSESRPAKPLVIPVRSANPWSILSPVEWALAAAILLFLALPVWNRQSSSVPDPSSLAMAEHVDSEAQIAQDNDLLRSIDVALTANEISPASEYHIVEQPHRHSKGNSGLEN